MKPERVVMSFRHITGTQCRITITHAPGDLVEVGYSLRSGSMPVCNATAERWLAEWQMWFLHFSKAILPPQIPDGWH